MPADIAMRPLEQTAAETASHELAARDENEADWRLDRLVAESDALLWSLEACNLREQAKLGRRLVARMNGFIDRVLFELPETLAVVSGLQSVKCGTSTTIAKALDRVYAAQEALFALRRPQWAAVLAELEQERGRVKET